MIKTIEGTPSEIAAVIAQLFSSLPSGEIRPEQPTRAVLVLEQTAGEIIPKLSDAEITRLMEEMDRDAVSVGHVDDSREAMYTRMPGE